MSVSSAQDFQRCRLCALPISSNSLISFFDTIYEPMIAKLTLFGLHINKDDGLPDCICQGCTGILTTFIETMELFLAADRKLKRILEASKQKSETLEKQTSDSVNVAESNENQEKRGSKRKAEDDDIEILETKRIRRKDGLNLLKKLRTSLPNDSKIVHNKDAEQKREAKLNKKEEIDEKSESLNQSTDLKKKHERKQNVKVKVRSDSVDANKTQTDNSKIKTDETRNCSENELSYEIINVENDHNYGIICNEKKAEEKIPITNPINSLMQFKEEIKMSGDSGTQISKTIPSKHIKILTFEKLELCSNLPTASLKAPNSLPSVYTQPSDDKEIDVFTCLECNQIFWNRKVTLEHIYKEHAQGALTYKARYMVKRIKNARMYNPEKRIVCTLCCFTFHDSHSFLEHLTGHYMSVYKCVHCNQNYATKDALQKHKHERKNDIITCKICDKSMVFEVYHIHERAHSLQSRFQTIIDRNKMESVRKSMSDDQFNGNEKNQSFKNLNSQNTISGGVAVRKSEVKQIICKVKENGAPVDSKNPSSNVHQTVNSSDEDKAIEEIKRKFQEKLKLLFAKKNANIYKCSTCLQIFRDRNAMLKHMQKMHPLMWADKKNLLTAKKLQTDDQEEESSEIYMCRICTTDFDTKSKYFSHLETHHNCKYCNKTFYHKEEMKVHQRSHEKPYRCDICDASFYVEKNYLDHKLTHSYQCDFCKASYRTMESLVNHKKIVHPKISCPICLVGFESAELLNKHEATHTKQKTPTLCEFCGKSYSNITRFNFHMRTHNKNNKFTCQFCPMSFKSNPKLKRHLRFSHLDDYTESLRESLEIEEN